MTRPHRRRPRCPTCSHLKSAVAIARGDLGDTKSKLLRAQRTQRDYPEQLDRYLTDIEARKASLTHAKTELERHLAECQVIVTTPDPAPRKKRRLLTEDEIHTIRRLLHAGETPASIAADFGVARSTVANYTEGITRESRFVFDDQPWADDALCAQTDPEAFYPEKGGSTREAKQICMSCPVRTQCLDYAVEHQERFGVWGGLTEKERRKLVKQRSTRPAGTEGVAV